MNKICFRPIARTCLYVACVLLGLALLPSCAAVSAPAVPELLEPVNAPSDIIAVARGTVRQQNLFEGTVTPYCEPLSFKATGLPLLAVYVKHGQSVREGEILAELDTAEYFEVLEDLRDTLAHNERVWAHENALAEISAGMAGLETPDAEYGRQMLKYRVSEINMSLAQAKDLQALERERLSAKIANMEALSGGYQIKAPFDGVVMYIADIRIGETPALRAPIIYLADMNRVTINCGSDSAGSLRGSVSVFAVIDGAEYAVTEISMTAEEKMSYYFAGTSAPVRLAAVDESAALTVGKNVIIQVFGGVSEDTLWIPPNAVHSEREGVRYVYTDEGGIRVRRNVKTGIESDTRTEILEGLAEGDMVYVD